MCNQVEEAATDSKNSGVSPCGLKQIDWIVGQRFPLPNGGSHQQFIYLPFKFTTGLDDTTLKSLMQPTSGCQGGSSFLVCADLLAPSRSHSRRFALPQAVSEVSRQPGPGLSCSPTSCLGEQVTATTGGVQITQRECVRAIQVITP